MPKATRLEISVLGVFSARLGATEVRIPSRKGCALLGYLALAEGCEAPRETLLALLWSDSSEAKARASLRQVLHELQRAFQEAGFEGLHSERLLVRLAPQSIRVDLLEVMRLAKEGHGHSKLFARQRLMESLLRDLEGIDPAFREWLAAKRQSLSERLIDDLTASLRRLPPGSNQLELSRAILSVEPTHEEAARCIIRAQASAGDVGGALRVYKNLWDLLDREFDVEPAKETQELIAAIKLGQPVAMAALEAPRTVVVAQSSESDHARGTPAQRETFIRKLVGPYGGRLTAREKDTYVLDFPDPRTAVHAALGIADVGANGTPGPSGRTRLRMGAHTSAGLGDDRTAATEIAGQLAALAEPGELVVSDQVRDVLTDGLDGWIEDTGNHPGGTPLRLPRAYRIGAPAGPESRAPEEHIQPVVAIIPFELKSRQAKHLLVGEVLADELIASFCAAKELAVISRLSTRAFRDRQLRLEEVRDRLGADYVLSGTYAVRANTVSLGTEFADARSGTVLWRRNSRENINAILSSSTELVGEIVAATGASILNRELDRARSRPLETLQNYALLMAAINLSHRTTPASFAQARVLLQLLMERLPAHPLPLAWLAKWHVFRVNQGWSDNLEADAQLALDFATQAIESDPSCSIALTVDAWANLSLRKRFDVADQRFQQAVEANSSDSIAWLLKGMMHAFRGEGRIAVASAQRAIHLSPLDPRRSYYDSLAATAHLSAGNFKSAIELAERSLRVDKLHASTLRALAIAQFLSGREDDARRTVAALLRVDPTSTVSRYLRRHPAAAFATGQLWAETLGKAGLPA